MALRQRQERSLVILHRIGAVISHWRVPALPEGSQPDLRYERPRKLCRQSGYGGLVRFAETGRVNRREYRMQAEARAGVFGYI